MTFGKKEFAALVAEFLGTGALTLLILSIKYTSLGVAFFVAAVAGIAVTSMSLAVAGVSGGYFNPALTLAMWTARKIDTVRGVLYIAVQLLAGFAAFHLFTYFINNDLSSVSGGHFTWRIMTAEAVATGVFAFAWASTSYKRLNVPVTAALAGLAYMIAIIISSAPGVGSAQGGLYTGFANPAVALGAKSWVWGTYVLGPVVGGVIGANLYTYLFAGTETAVAAAKPAAAVTATSAKPASKTGKAKKSRAKK